MKGINHPTNDVTLNPSGNESILDVAERGFDDEVFAQIFSDCFRLRRRFDDDE